MCPNVAQPPQSARDAYEFFGDFALGRKIGQTVVQRFPSCATVRTDEFQNSPQKNSERICVDVLNTRCCTPCLLCWTRQTLRERSNRRVEEGPLDLVHIVAVVVVVPAERDTRAGRISSSKTGPPSFPTRRAPSRSSIGSHTTPRSFAWRGGATNTERPNSRRRSVAR